MYVKNSSQNALPLPYGTTQQFSDAQINNAPRRGYETGEIRYNTTTNKLEVFNNGVWAG